MSDATCVWFQRSDHSGFWRRLAACLIDAAVVLGLIYAVAALLQRAVGPTTQPTAPVQRSFGMLLGAAGLMLVFFALPYHVGMRLSAGGTLGYRLVGQRLIDFKGQRPAFGAILKRFLLSLMFPAIYLVLIGLMMSQQPAGASQPKSSPTATRMLVGLPLMALLFSGMFASYWTVVRDFRRQAIHDKWSRTWVIRANARPAGAGRLVERAWVLGPVIKAFWDVDPVEPADAAGAVRAPQAAAQESSVS
mgnify:CR=1 FL=1